MEKTKIYLQELIEDEHFPIWKTYDVIEFDSKGLAKEWGSLPHDATDRQEQAVLNNWFNLMAFRLIRLSEKHNIKYS